MNHRTNKRVPNNQSYRAPPTAQFQPYQQQANPQNLPFTLLNQSYLPPQPFVHPPVQYVRGYIPPPMQEYPVQHYPVQQHPNQNDPQIGFNGCYPPQSFPCHHPSTSGDPQNFVPQPPPSVQFGPEPSIYYTGPLEAVMQPYPPSMTMVPPLIPSVQPSRQMIPPPMPTIHPTMPMAPQPMSMVVPPIQRNNGWHRRFDNPPPPKSEAAQVATKVSETLEQEAAEGKGLDIFSDALRELKINISILESAVRYQEKNNLMDRNERMADSHSESQQSGETFDSRPPSVATVPKKAATPMKHVVTEIKKSAQKVDKLMRQEQCDLKTSEKPSEDKTGSRDSKDLSIPTVQPLTVQTENLPGSKCDVAVKIPFISPAPSDPTMSGYSSTTPEPVMTKTTSIQTSVEKTQPPQPIEKKPIDYSQWVDVKKQHRKWKDELRQETKPRIVTLHTLVLAKEIRSIPLEISTEAMVEDQSVPNSEPIVEKKRRNRSSKKKRDKQQKEKGDEDFDEYFNNEAQVSSLFDDVPYLFNETSKGKKHATEVKEDEDQGKYHEEKVRKILPNYSSQMRTIRQSHYLFEKERGPLPDFQMEVINHWKHYFLFGLPERFRRQGIYRKVLRRILMYRSDSSVESQKMFFFLESLNKTRDPQDEVINADLLYIYETDMEDSLLKDQEKKYYDTIMTFSEWRPKTWNRVPVNIQDLKKIPVSIEEERMQKFNNLINKQGLRRMICKTAPEIKQTYVCSVEEVIHIAHLSSRGQENDWSTFHTREFLNARLVALREEEQTAETLMHIRLYEFLLHVTSSVLNFNVFWLKSCFQYSDGRATPNGDDSLLRNLFW